MSHSSEEYHSTMSHKITKEISQNSSALSMPKAASPRFLLPQRKTKLWVWFVAGLVFLFALFLIFGSLAFLVIRPKFPIFNIQSSNSSNLNELLVNLSFENPNKRIKEEEEPVEKMDQLATHECCYETEDSDMNNEYTILVRGLDTSLTRDEAKSALTKHFESWGCQVLRVFVPIECLTGARLGIAFIDVDDEERGLKLSYKGGWNLYLTLAKYSPEYHHLPNFKGCQHCGSFLLERRLKRFLDRPPRRY